MGMTPCVCICKLVVFSKNTVSPNPDNCAESSSSTGSGGVSTSTPSAGNTNSGISSSSSSTTPKKPFVKRLVASGGAAAGIGGDSLISSRHPKNLTTSTRHVAVIEARLLPGRITHVTETPVLRESGVSVMANGGRGRQRTQGISSSEPIDDPRCKVKISSPSSSSS